MCDDVCKVKPCYFSHVLFMHIFFQELSAIGCHKCQLQLLTMFIFYFVLFHYMLAHTLLSKPPKIYNNRTKRGYKTIQLKTTHCLVHQSISLCSGLATLSWYHFQFPMRKKNNYIYIPLVFMHLFNISFSRYVFPLIISSIYTFSFFISFSL